MEFQKSNVSKCKLNFVNKIAKPEKNVELIINVKSNHDIDMHALGALLDNIQNIQLQGYNLQKKK